MAGIRAAVLAAGRGVRMGGRVPKALLPLGDEEPLLHFVLGGLKAARIDDVLVVTGFRGNEVQSYVAERLPEATFVVNARYASWGNFHSVRLALEQSPSADVLVVNSDVIVPPSVYRQVAATNGDLVLAVDRRKNLDQEDMRVTLEGDRVVAIGKQLRKARSHGEYAGVSLLRREAALLYLDAATDLEWRSETALYYEDVYGSIMGLVETRATVLEPGSYAEVDEPRDVQRAVAVIERHRSSWPTLERSVAVP